MNTFKKALITITMLASATAAASTADDIARIRQLLPAGQDIAQIQSLMLRGSTEAQAIEDAKPNYLIRDVNHDGLLDVLVLAEENPKMENNELTYGKRSLMFFLGQKDGSVKLQFINDKMVFGADEGGTFGDPLNGFYVRPNGSITLMEYGGSAWRWSYTDVLQFRKGELYLVGRDSYYGWTGDLRADTVSENFLTGLVIKTHQKNGDAPVQTKRYRVPVKPLVRAADYVGDNN